MPPEQQKEQAIIPPEEANKTSLPHAVETPSNNGTITAKEDPNRNPDGTFKEGNKLSKGKPVGAKHLTTLLREAITKVADGDEDPSDVAIIKKVVQMAKRGDLSAVSMIWGRLEGTIPQTMIMEGNAFAGLDDKQKAKLNALLGIEPENKECQHVFEQTNDPKVEQCKFCKVSKAHIEADGQFTDIKIVTPSQQATTPPAPSTQA